MCKTKYDSIRIYTNIPFFQADQTCSQPSPPPDVPDSTVTSLIRTQASATSSTSALMVSPTPSPVQGDSSLIQARDSVTMLTRLRGNHLEIFLSFTYLDRCYFVSDQAVHLMNCSPSNVLRQVPLMNTQDIQILMVILERFTN